ncbi:MAG: hypothetical protein FJ202_04915 [Gemmatimonadetes bacterium]|nr:hypothetical protein [Gemmatimonadota bacterium]
MTILCLSHPDWRPGAPPRPELAAALLARAPRIAISGPSGGASGGAPGGAPAHPVIWADVRGFSLHGQAELAADLIALLAHRGVPGVRAGLARVPVAAELAARFGDRAVTLVPTGNDRAYVALFPLEALGPDPRLRPLLFGIGVSTCGELAALTQESVEVRLGAPALPLWRLARADDPRLLFAPPPAELPHASLDWVEYALKDPARLLFVINTLLERVTATLAARGEGAREVTVEFALTNRQSHVEVVRASRPTVNRRTWFRLIRTRVDAMKLHAAVTGITLHASRVAAREAPQADLFDRGLASVQATEDAVARLVEDQGPVVVAPQNSAHPLLDERTTWVAQEPAKVVAPRYAGALMTDTPRHTVRFTTLPAVVRETATVTPAPSTPPAPRFTPHLSLQLSPTPCAISVETVPRRDHAAPVRYRDEDGWHEIVQAAGPERISGRHWEGDTAYAREYFRCITRDGRLVWLYRDAAPRAKTAAAVANRQWYLHGWWD